MSEAPREIWASVAGTNSEGRFGMWDLRKARADNPDYANYIRKDIAQAELDAAVRAEREACAKVADMLHQHWAHAKGRNPDDYTSAYSRLRDAIRERGE